MSMLTLFTDASFCSDTKASGYGAWAKADGWPKGRFFGDRLPPCNNSGEAELTAIARALDDLDRLSMLHGIRTIMVQVDNVRVLELLVRFANASIAPHEHSASVEYREKLIPAPGERRSIDSIVARKIALVVRQVRGHSNYGSRESVNNVCDRIARRHMRAMRGRR